MIPGHRHLGAIAARLPDGRLHLQHGPIDLIIDVTAAKAERQRAFDQAIDRFATILEELVADLPVLTQPQPQPQPQRSPVHSSTARVMQHAVAPYQTEFVTPMASVAGAVADTVLAAMVRGRDLARAYVNNGGDIAIHLSHAQTMRIAIHDRGDAGRVMIQDNDPVRGIATSGWRGRSMSFGIADAVTVLAETAAMADVAATMIANAVDLPGHRGIVRTPAVAIDANSDLGQRLVTTGVPRLSSDACDTALARGLAYARDLQMRGLIVDATLILQDAVQTLTQTPAKVHLDA